MSSKSKKIKGVVPREKLDVCQMAIRAITEITIPLIDASERAGNDERAHREEIMRMYEQFQAICGDFAP